MTRLTEEQERLCTESTTDYFDLRALFVNCTLKRGLEISNTQGLIDISIEIMRRNGVEVECLRAIDHQIATGLWSDMTEHGWDADEWPEIFERVMAADILVLGTPIWLGEKSSVATRMIERLYGNSGLLNDAGWIGEVGPGPSYLDQGSGGPKNDFTNRNTTFAAWNMLHLARMLKDAGGIPTHGNQRSAWDAGCSLDFPNPEYRK